MLHIDTDGRVSKKKEGAKPLIVVSNETFGGSSQILSTSGHKERSAGCSGGRSQRVSRAQVSEGHIWNDQHGACTDARLHQ